MIPNSSKITICFLAIIILVGFFAIVVHGAFNPQINYQGKLTDTNDVAVADDDYNFEFKLYATSTGGSAQWTETCTSSSDKITVTNGLFSHLLGSVHSFSEDSVDFNQTLWLEVSIAGTTTDPTSSDWETLSPRKKLGAVPAAFVAEKIGDYGTSSIAILSEDETITGAWTFNNILSAAASSSSAILTVNQTGSGNIVDFQVATTSKFVINNSGEITTGEWKATAIGTQWGGTGQDWSQAATGSIPFATSTGVFDLLAPGTSGYYLKTQGAGAAPTWAAVSATNYYGPTVIVAASDSTSTSRAHYQCSGTDDQVQINDAINALPADGGVVYLLEGTYNIATSTGNLLGIYIATSNVALVGSGRGTILKRMWNETTANNSGMITITSVSTDITDIFISQLQIDGNRGNYNNSNNHGIFLSESTSGLEYPKYIQIKNNWVNNNAGNGIYVEASNWTDAYYLFEGNIIRNNSESGIYIDDLDAITITGNAIEGNTGYGIFLISSGYNTITGNTIEGNSGDGIYMNGGVENTVTGNTIKNNSSEGIFVTSSYYNTVSGNAVVENAGSNGGICITGDYNAITGNVVEGNTEGSGIVISGGDGNAIVGNKIHNNDSGGDDDGISIGSNADKNLISSNDITDTVGSGYAIDIASGCDNNYLVGNRYSGTGADSIRDSGTGTIYGSQLYGASDSADLILKPLGNVGIGTKTPSAFLDVYASTTASVLTVTQDGSGNIVEVKNATGTVFTIASNGNATLAGDFLPATTTQYDLGSLTYKWANLYSATATLDVFKMATGATSSYVLTSDASGVGTWQAAAGGTDTNYYGPTIIVAASDSTSTDRAHYQCSGTDDQVQINNAINALPAGIGGTVLLLEGNYSIGSSTGNVGINITTSSVALIGSGKGTVLKRAFDELGGYPGDGFITVGNGSDSYEGIVVANLSIDGQKTAHSGSYNHGIYFTDKISKSRIQNTWVYNCDGHGIYFRGTSNTYNLIEGNDVRDNDNNGIELYSSGYNTLSDNTIQGNSDDGGNGGILLYISNNNTISGNVVQGNSENGIIIDGGSYYNAITGNTVQGNSNDGIYIDNMSHNNTLTGNTIQGNDDGIFVWVSNYTVISGNVISGNSFRGIYFDSSGYSSITGNKIHDNGGDGSYDGIRIEDNAGDNNLISSNDITDTEGSGYAINIADSGCDNNYLIGNRYSGTGASSINDSGTGTVIQHKEWFEIEPTTLSVNYPGLLIGSSDTSWATGTQTYLGIAATSTFSGNLVDIQKAGTSMFKIDASGNVATGTWQGTVLSTQYGGTGQDWSSAATGSLPFATSTGVFDLLAPGTSDYYLKSQGAGASPVWAEVSATNYYGPTIIVAASDSTSTSRAHYQCDGTADQVEINQAINALPAGGGVIQLLEGTYNVTSTITVTSSVAIRGAGASTILYLSNSANTDVIQNSDQTNGNTNIHLNNFKIHGNDSNNTSGKGIYFKKVTYSKINNLWVYDCDDEGIEIYDSDYNTFSDNYFYSNSKGLYIQWSSTYNTVSGNNFESNSTHIDLYNGCTSNTISGNNLKYSVGRAIDLYGSDRNVISNNTIYMPGNEGIHLDGSEYNSIVGNNIYQALSSDGINLYDYCSFNTISGNLIYNSDKHGIHITSLSDNNSITGNVIIDSDSGNSKTYDGISLDTSSDNNIISSNRIQNSDRYEINIASGCSNNYLIGNDTYGTDHEGEINDDGTGTVIQHKDWFEVEASSTIAALTVQQDGSGNIVEIKNATGTVFTIASNGNATLAGDFLPATTTQYSLGSSTYKWANLYSATATLDVFKMATGATSSYVLTSDASGVGTWQAAAGGTDTNYYGPTVIVAASDSTSTSRAHYQCDGTDDQVDINNAINALPAGIGGTVLLLEGNYSIATSGIDITTSSVSLIGSGKGTVLQRAWNATPTFDGVITVGDGSNSYEGITIANLSIDGQKTIYNQAITYNVGILFNENITKSRIQNTWVHDCDGGGIDISGDVGSESTDNLIQGNDVRDNDYSGILIGDYCHNNIVTDNNLYSNYYGVYYNLSDYIIVSNNNIQSSDDFGIYIRYSGNSIITGNNIQSSGNSGIYIQEESDVNNSLISGNSIQLNTNYGIYGYTVKNTTISGNRIYDNGDDEIELKYSDNNIISSNFIYDTTGYGIHITSDATSDDNYIIGNEITGMTTKIKDEGTGTTIQQRDWFEVEASSTIAALTVQQDGSGNIVEIKNATGTVFTIASNGNATLAGDFLPATTTTYDLGSSTYKWANIYAATTTLDAFKMATGATSGYVLTAATSGVGTWQAAAGGTDTNYYGPTVIVAASDSTSTSRAHYQCDGTDDQVQINNAINALPAGIGGTVLLLEGTYYIGSTTDIGINITTSSVALIGSGKGTVLERAWNSGYSPADGVITVGDGTNAYEGITIANLSIDGQKGNYAGDANHCIYFNKKITRSRIQNTWVYDCDGRGIYIYGSSGSENTENSIVKNNIWNLDGICIYLSYSNDNTIEGNVINTGDNSNNGIYLSNSDYNTIGDNDITADSNGIEVNSNSNYNTVTGNVIRNYDVVSGHSDIGILISADYNTISSNVVYHKHDGIILFSSVNTVNGNIINDMSGYGIYTTGDYNSITGNEIYDSDGTSPNGVIYLSGADYNTFAGNAIFDVDDQHGIHLNNSTFNSITGNTVRGVKKHGIYLDTSDNNTISANTVKDSDSGNTATYDGIYLANDSDNNIISSNRLGENDRYEINISSTDCNENYLIGNETTGSDHEGEINDAGTGTVIQHKDLFEIAASTTQTALTVQQDGSGNIVEIKNATGTVFTIASSGNATLAGDFLPATTTTYDLGSSTYKWANLYAATTTIGGTIIIGTDTITVTSTLTVSTGASSDLVLTPGTGGSVGIGTTTPTGIFSVATSTGASVFYIGEDGNVGIGTTTPDYALDVAGPIRFRGWQDLSSPFTDDVESLTVWNGRLCAGSKDEHVRCYDGSTWEDLGDVGSHVYDLTVWNGKLCEGNNDNHVRCYATSTWEDLGDVGGCIDSITVWNGKLCEGNDDSHIKCYDGSTWEDLGSFDDVDVLTVWNGKLCVGDWSDHVRCYDGSTWEDLGDVGSNIYSLTVWNGKLCEGNVDGHVKCYDGSTWEDLGDVAGDYYVSALTVWNGKLCEGSTDDHVRCYDGSSWEDLGDFGNNIGVLAVWNGKLCEGDENFKVKCYFDSEALDNYWYKNGDILRWDRIVEAGDLYVEGNIGIGTKAPSSKLTITETGDFAFGDFNAQLVATMELVTDWTSSDGANTTTSLEISTVKVGSGALKITTTVGTSTNDTISKTIYSEDWSSYERLGFWVRADYTTTSTDATTSQIISIQFYCTSTPATTTHNITIQEMTKWQYQEWNISSATSTNIEWIRFRIDNDYGSPTFYIDHLRLYDDDERTSEMFVDKSGNLVMMGRGGVEITRPSTGSGQLPSLKIDAAVVELNQPLSVNVAGDVGFDYDLTFMNTGLSQITSEGPLKISAGDPNHAENLTLTTSGSGDIIVALTQSGQTFRITHALAASTTVPFIIDSETTATSTPTGGLFRVVSDVNSDENVVFTIDAGGNYAFDGTATSGAEDIAENYIVEDETIEPGDVVALSQNKLVVEKSTQPYQENLIGVISSRPALVMAGTLPNSKPVTLAGRVPVKVSTEAGIIEIGDPLTSASSTPGVAMKATRPSRIIGYALEPFDGTTTSSSTEAGPLLAENATSTENAYGKILVFINVGETTLTVTETSDGKLTETRPLQLAEVPQFFVVNGDGSLGIQKVKVKELEVGRLKVGVPQNTTTTQTAANGITIYDRATGEPYCIYMENGKMRNAAGECSSEMSNTQTGGGSEPIINGEQPAEEPPTGETSTSTESIPSADSTSSPQADSEPPCQPQTFYLDADGDNYGDPVNNISSCEQSTGYVTDNADCNDSDPNVNPLATEICDGVDNDCDGQIDEDLFQQCGSTDVGACQYGTQTCQAGEWGECQGAIEPTEEICGDNFDNNCDGTTDENCQTEPATTTEIVNN